MRPRKPLPLCETRRPIRVAKKSRKSIGGFLEPLPPPACQADSQGYCAIVYQVVQAFHMNHGEAFDGQVIFHVFDTGGRRYINSATEHTYYARCGSPNWSPWEPKVHYGDPNLP